MKERAKRFLTSIVAALTLVGSVPTQAYASGLEPDSSLISPQDDGSTPDTGNTPAVESSTPVSSDITDGNATTTNSTTTNTTVTDTTTNGTTTTETTTTETTTTETTTTETTTNSTTTDDSTDIGENDPDESDLGEDELGDLDLEDMADDLVLSFEASTFSLRTTAAQEPTLLAEVENQTATPVVKIGETTLGDAATDAGWSGGSGWRYNGSSVSMVNNGTAVDVHAEGAGIDFSMAGVNHIGTLYADGDVNITGTGILLIDAIDMLEGKSLNLLTNTDRYEAGTGSVAVFVRNAETGEYELINGNGENKVTGILDEEYTIPDGIKLVVPDGGTLDMRITTQVKTTTNGESETHYGLTNTDYGLLDADVTSGENSYTKEVKEGENLVSRVLGITVPTLTISSGASLLLKGNAKLLMEAFGETVLTHAHHSSTLVVNGALTLADSAALELTNHASDINTHTSSSQFSVVMNEGGNVTGSGTLSGAAVTYKGGSGAINFTGNNSYVDVQCSQNPGMTFTTTGNTDVFYSDGKTLKALEAKNGGSFSLYAKAADETSTTSIDGFASHLNITDSVSGTCNVKSGYVSLKGNLMNEQFKVNNSDYGPGKLQIISLTKRNTYIERNNHNGFSYFSSGATNTYNSTDWTQREMYDSDLSQTNPYSYNMLSYYLNSLGTESEPFVCATDTQLFEIYMRDPTTNVTTVSLLVKSPANSNPICIGEAVDPAKVFLVRCIAGTVTTEAPFTGSIVNPGTSNTGSGILGGSNAGSFNGGGSSSVLGGDRKPSGGDSTDNGNTDNNNTDNDNTDNDNTDNNNTENNNTENGTNGTESSASSQNPSVNIDDTVAPTASAEVVRDAVVKVSDIGDAYRLTIVVDGVEQKTLAGGTIPVAMEVSLEEGWNQNDLFVVFRGENGKLVAVKARYNSATRMLMFDAPMLGKFQLVSFPWNGTDYESDTFLAALDDYMN